MEALAAIGLASNIVQFISFTREIVSTSRQISGNAGGLVSHLELEAIAKNIQQLDLNLQVTQRNGIEPAEDQTLRVGITTAVEQALRRNISPEHDYALWKAVTDVVSQALPKDMVFAVDRALHDGIFSAISLAQRNDYHPAMKVTTGNAERVSMDRKALRLRINIAVDQALREGTSSAEDQELRKLCEGCSHVAGELQAKIRSLGASQKLASSKSKPWTNFRQALATVMKADDIEELETRMERYQKGVNTALLVSLRRQIMDEQKKGAARDERMSTRLLGFIANTKTWQANIIDTLYRSKWQPGNEQDTQQFAHHLIVGAGIDAQRLHQQRIHQLLRFEEITDRHETIADAHRETFRWVYYQDHEEIIALPGSENPSEPAPTPQYNSFSDWLSGDGNVYWITGKPGSGKSTLVKYLADEPATLRLAKAWSGDNKLVIARYFFWNSGTKMQMSKMGLLQTLLYQSLQGRERLIPSLFANRWTNYKLFGADLRPWTWSELTHALSSLFGLEDQRLLLFIDGLDEFESDPSDLVALILNWTKLSPLNIKICVSSRPWLVFEESFKGVPWLRMEDLTRPDIQRYVERNMSASSQWQDLQNYLPEETSKIIEEITEKAVGVFLWVSLVVSSLVEGLRDGDSVEDLWQRLNALPSRLEALFQSILSGLNPEYFAQSCELFQLVLTAFEPPTLLEMVFAQEGVNPAIEARLGRPDMKRLNYSTEMMRRRIASRSKGLLEAPKFTADREAAKVEYLHRTVRDFFQGPEAWTYIRSGAPTYDAALLLAASSLRMAKMTPQNHRASVFDQFWRASASCVEYARKREDTQGVAPINLLDELEMTGHVYWTKEPLTQRSTYQSWMSELVDATPTRTSRESFNVAVKVQETKRSHGSKTLPWQNTIHLCETPTFYPVIHLQSLLKHWAVSTFFDMMFIAGIKSYVATKLTNNNIYDHSIRKLGAEVPTPILSIAISYHDYALAKKLLEHNADPNAKCGGSETTWSLFLKMARSHTGSSESVGVKNLAGAMIDHGADPAHILDADFEDLLSELDAGTSRTLKVAQHNARHRLTASVVRPAQKHRDSSDSLRVVLRRKFKSWSGTPN